VTPILVIAGLTLLASFACSLFEAALYAVTPARIEVLRRRGRRGAEHLARLRSNVEEPIAAILTVNTLAHTVGAAWCGALVGERYGSVALGVFAAAFTVLVLALTEIVPKSLGVRYAGQIGPAIALPIQLMIWSVWPIVWVSKHAMRMLTRPGEQKGPSEEEVVVFTELAAQGGRLRPEERRWVENALRLDSVTAGDLRTPRTVIESLDAGQRIGDVAQHPERFVHSRVPLTEGGDLDQLIGLVHRREVFDTALSGGADRLLAEIKHPIQFVPEAMPAHELLNLFLSERVHMVAVADEYGGLAGVVTLEDVLECLLGKEIVDEHDEIDDMQEHALERGRARSGLEPEKPPKKPEPSE
jgi:CBS domain containing-hemolysin-like protein